MEFRRKLYTRGSSFETTIPRPLLFSIDKQKKYEVVFAFDSTLNKWFIEIKDRETEHEQAE
ncbi:MAG: hypothetical protein V1866_00795 [archaeon]